MQLQHLVISGFKSFPDRSHLKFDDGVTAIVGPNGCGKSNVVDAITWVLGEQSAKSLRGDRMEDVIFSGSDGRKPTAAAEVKLLLRGVTTGRAGPTNGHGHSNGTGHGTGNNTPKGDGHAAMGTAPMAVAGPEPLPATGWDEGAGQDVGPSVARDVEVSRRLYRSGESEYLIDGEVCRLRDVQDLLMDSGVGIKAYAVIEQGQIGQILSARPNERRQLIEEAAGVMKYKTRRRAAEFKLDAAEQNLTRVDDIVHEVDKQRNALKRQAAKARRYRRLRDELRRWEKVSFTMRHRRLSDAIEAALAKLTEARTREGAAAARLAALEATQAQSRIALVEGETRATASRDAAHARELEIGRLQHRLEFDRQQVADLGTLSEELRVELGALEARRMPAREALEQRRADASDAKAARGRAEQHMASFEASYATARHDVEGMEGDVEAARVEVFAAINAATALRHVAEHAASARERVKAELAKLDVETADLEAERTQWRANRQSVMAERTKTQETLDEAVRTHAVRRDECSELQRDREACVKTARTHEQELTAMAARVKSLEELEAARAGYGDAARLILAEGNGVVGHMGSVADYLEVGDRYERAVEACLGDLLQHVVVASHERAAAGLQFVRDHDAGRCGFLVVESSTNGDRRSSSVVDAGSLPAGLVPLMSVVKVRGSAAPAIREAIGHAFVAESLEQALSTAGGVAGPVATLSGEVVRGRHQVFGGGKAEARGILATKRQIKELRAAIAPRQAEADATATQLGAIEQRVTWATTALATLMEQRQAQDKAILELDLRLSTLQDEAERIRRKQELLDAERRRAQEECASFEARHLETRESIARLDGEQRAADERLTSAQRRVFEARTSIEVMGEGFADAKAAHAGLVERATAVAAEVVRLEEASAELETRATTRRDDLSRADSRRQSLQVQIGESARRFDRGVGELERLRQEMQAADDALTGLRTRVDAQDVAIREARGAHEDIRSGVGQLEVSHATAQAERSHLAAACLETVQVDLDSVIAEVEQLERDGEITPDAVLVQAPEDDADEEETAAGEAGVDGAEALPPTPRPTTADGIIVELKEKIERLGAVNMMAIEQFDELDERHLCLTTPRRDLRDSIAATTEAIRRINKTTTERFRAALDAINVHYQQTFSTLFGGGRAGLVLLDEADLLESGIDIIAQPPGKRLQSVQLLSGGEKALAAMALMFAIFKYKPSPFCLLDEIDAPLDEANIGRFVDMLRGMLDATQFVLITHNRKTMEIADRLYGVTMEEPGVSKLISVQFN